MFEIALGCTPIGWALDIRDMLYDLTHLSEHSAAENAGLLALDSIGFVPVFGKLIGKAGKAKKLARLSKLVDEVPSGNTLSGNPQVHLNANAASLDSVPASRGFQNTRNADALYPGSGVSPHELRYNTGMPGRGNAHTGGTGATSKQHSSAERYLAGRSQGPGSGGGLRNAGTNQNLPNSLNPKDINFMQSSIKNQTGSHTVLGNAEALSRGTLKPSDLPSIKVWKDSAGKIWTLDHRRLAAFRLADNVKNVPVQWATPKEISSQMWKMTTKNQGVSIRLKLGDGKSMTVK